LWNIGDVEPTRLGDFEYLVLLAVVRIGPDAYGATVRREIETQTQRHLGISAVYTTLERLEQKGLVRSWTGASAAARQGRRRKHFELTAPGLRAVKETHRIYAAMTAGLKGRLKAVR